MVKICTKCKVEKILVMFSKDKYSKDGYCYQCKECRAKYAEDNKERFSSWYANYNLENKENHAEYNRNRYLNNRDAILARNNLWEANNPEWILNYDRVYSAKPEVKEQRKKNRKIREKRPDVKEKLRISRKARWNTDITFRLHSNFSRAIRTHLKDNCVSKNNISGEKIAGYTIKDLKNHLESLWTEGMSWNNYGKGEEKWHIDHIIPRCACTFDSYEHSDFKKCWELSNLRPLWEKDNLKKIKEDLKVSIKLNRKKQLI